MDPELAMAKFGPLPYKLNDSTCKMGIHYMLADKIAARFDGYGRVLDACCGAGFTSIALAKYAGHVIAIDNNEEHFDQARFNARLAHCENKIEFVLGDVLEYDGAFDAAFLDPDWARGNRRDKSLHVKALDRTNPPADVLFTRIYNKTHDIALRLPKELDLSELEKLPEHETEWLEHPYLDRVSRFYCVYFGDLQKR